MSNKTVTTKKEQQIQVRDLRKAKFVTITKEIFQLLSPYEVSAYLAIDFHRNNKREDSFAGISRMSDLSSMTERHFRRCLRSLEEKEVIKTEKIDGKTNTYYILK